jgi:large subunit ribosomal protein L10
MPTPRKIVQVADLTVKMQKMQAVIVADYRGITVAEITKLRNKLRPLGGEFVIAKNTLALIAARATGNGDIEPALYGPTALCFAYGDAAAVAKALKEYNTTAKKLTFRGGLLGNAFVPGDASIDVIGSMPTRLEALAQILGVVEAPVAGIVNVLNSTATSVVYAVQARIDKMEEEKAA